MVSGLQSKKKKTTRMTESGFAEKVAGLFALVSVSVCTSRSDHRIFDRGLRTHFCFSTCGHCACSEKFPA